MKLATLKLMEVPYMQATCTLGVQQPTELPCMETIKALKPKL